MLRRGERGQAVVETAIFMPIFLLALFGMFLAVTQGAMIERVQLGVRYGGLISGIQNPYTSTSLYAMYATLDGSDPASNSCAGVGANTLLLTQNRHTFWQPVAGSVSTTCWQSRPIVFAGSYNPLYTQSYNFLYHENFVTLAAQTPVSSFLTKGALAGATSVGTFGAENFTTSATLGDVLNCSYVGMTAKASLEANSYVPPLNILATSSAWAGSLASPLPTTLPLLINIPYPLVCNGTFGPQTIHTPPPS
jgi:Flp pilus assembly protein TadG